ncbi:MAG: phosphoglucosamine mutase [Gammaproteobacteria bacterium TMED95]|nr:phosphoglucosamine mutase [Gammaproteobacteria bacterium]OUV20314.1 MAG: phosphoglucosamine mutase [Gammaproteobacteria bacterium TMED95]
MSRKYFGTDGIRGPVGGHPINAEFVLKLGWAAGRVLSPSGGGTILIGKDTRISGYILESALEAGLASAGVNVLLLGPMPTPAVAYLTRAVSAAAGIVISASHNPYADNGIKFFSPDGQKISDADEERIENVLAESMTTVPSAALGRAKRLDDAVGRYVEFCKNTVPTSLRLKGLTLVVDCAHGAAYKIAPAVFRELGAEVITLGCEPDGLNINAGFGATSPQALAETVVREGADMGIALDGDADRLIMVDHNGEIVDGDELLFVLTEHAQQAGKFRGGVVGTKMSNHGLAQALAARDIPFVRADVGDRYVLAELNQREWSLGGEGSGHLLCLEQTTTGDGIVAALQVIKAVRERQESLATLKAGMTKLPQIMINVRNVTARVLEQPELQAAVNEVEAALAGSGRVLLRPSGTEPVVRVMVEGEDERKIKAHAEQLADLIRPNED